VTIYAAFVSCAMRVVTPRRATATSRMAVALTTRLVQPAEMMLDALAKWT
jgi:hypothetical protein